MKILNFGSANIDYVYSMDSIVKPGETVSTRSMEVFCGGKGLNQSIAAAKAGGNVYHAGMVGRDDGEKLLKKMNDDGVNTEHIKAAACPSGHAVSQVESSGQNSIFLYGGANRKIDEKYANEVLEGFEKNDILLLQNEISSLKYIAMTAHKKGMKVVLNPSPVNVELKELFPFVSYLMLNEDEGTAFTNESGYVEIADKLLSKYNEMNVVLTLGKKGVYFKNKDECQTHGIYKVKVTDTTAAGDTFIGYFISCIMRGKTVKEALQTASIASSLAVSRQGASDSIPLLEEVINANLEYEEFKK